VADTIRQLAALQALFPDNTAGEISPQDLRDFLVSAMPTGRSATKVVTHPAASALRKAQADYVLGGPDINAAIAAAGEGKVELTEGPFTLAAQVDQNVANQALVGQGPQATQIVVGTGVVKGIVLGASHLTNRGYWIYGADGDNGSNALGQHLMDVAVETGLSHLRFERLFVENCRNGMRWISQDYIWVSQCYFKTVNFGLGTMGPASTGRGSEHVHISDVTFEFVQDTAMGMHPSRDVKINNVALLNAGTETYGNLLDVSGTASGYNSQDIKLTNAYMVNGFSLISSETAALKAQRVSVANATAVNCRSAVIGAYYDVLKILNLAVIGGATSALVATDVDGLEAVGLNIDWSALSDVAAYAIVLTTAPRARFTDLDIDGSGKSTHGCVSIGAASPDVQFVNPTIRNSLYRGVHNYGARTTFIGGLIEGCATEGMVVGADDCKLLGTKLRDNSASGAGVASNLRVAGAVGGVRAVGVEFSGANAKYQYDEESASGAAGILTDCDIGAGATAKVRLQKTGSKVKDSPGYNPVGVLGPPAVPATTVAYTNAYGVDAQVFITGGTVTVIAIGSFTTGLTSGMFVVPAGQTITITYSSVPTWTWYGL